MGTNAKPAMTGGMTGCLRAPHSRRIRLEALSRAVGLHESRHGLLGSAAAFARAVGDHAAATGAFHCSATRRGVNVEYENYNTIKYTTKLAINQKAF